MLVIVIFWTDFSKFLLDSQSSRPLKFEIIILIYSYREKFYKTAVLHLP